jgi:fumarate hydratase subunit alpha
MPISSQLIRSVTAQMYEWSLKQIPDDTRDVLKGFESAERNPVGKQTLTIMLKSADTAKAGSQLVCSDVGFPVYMIKVGSRARIEGNLRQAITDGFADLVAQIDPPILQMVTHPLTHKRSYAAPGMPQVTFDWVDDADYIEITCSPKALGSGRWAALEIFVYPSMDQIEKYVMECVLRAGSQACPPIVVGVGIGGTFDYAAKMAKEATLRPHGVHSPDTMVAELEARLLKAVNATGFGPMGTGGDATAMAVNVNISHGHGFVPVAVCFNCWINRRTRVRINNDGEVTRYE